MWKDYITMDPEILNGKPVVKGTRLSVEFILGLLANGWSREDILRSYPQLDEEKLNAVILFAAECVKQVRKTLEEKAHGKISC